MSRQALEEYSRSVLARLVAMTQLSTSDLEAQLLPIVIAGQEGGIDSGRTRLEPFRPARSHWKAGHYADQGGPGICRVTEDLEAAALGDVQRVVQHWLPNPGAPACGPDQGAVPLNPQSLSLSVLSTPTTTPINATNGESDPPRTGSTPMTDALTLLAVLRTRESRLPE
jgi:hypothetical protein